MQKYNLQVDIWSLGVVFYVCLCGYPPFADEIPWHSLPIEEQIVEGKWRFDPGEPWDSISEGGASRIPPPHRHARARAHTHHPSTRTPSVCSSLPQLSSPRITLGLLLSLGADARQRCTPALHTSWISGSLTIGPFRPACA